MASMSHVERLRKYLTVAYLIVAAMVGIIASWPLNWIMYDPAGIIAWCWIPCAVLGAVCLFQRNSSMRCTQNLAALCSVAYCLYFVWLWALDILVPSSAVPISEMSANAFFPVFALSNFWLCWNVTKGAKFVPVAIE